MILQKKQVETHWSLPKAGVYKPTQSLSIPGQAFNVRLAMEQYKKGTIIERAVGFYEKEGFSMPDFNMMAKTEVLAKLGEYRKTKREMAAKLDRSHEIANQKYLKDVEKQKQSQGSRKSDLSGKQPGGNDTGTED